MWPTSITPAHIERVVADEGQWVGILNQDGWPILEMPAQVQMTAPQTRLDPASAEAIVSVAGGTGNRVLDELVADGLGRTDVSGRLVPASGGTRFLCVVRPGKRLVYTITHCVVSGKGAPSTLAVHGVDLLEGLAWWPCPSIPRLWMNRTADFRDWAGDESGVVYSTPRSMVQVEMAVKADGYTLNGPARTVIRRVIQDSFDAVNGLMQWGTPHAVVDYTPGADETPEVMIRTDDSPVWDTISDPALQAGVNVSVDLWWPGDDPVTVRTSIPGADKEKTGSRSWEYPMQIVRVF